MELDKSYKISVIGQGLNLEREVSSEIGEKIVFFLLTGNVGKLIPHKGVDAELDSQTVGVPSSIYPEVSLREFMNEQLAKRIPDKIATMAFYIREYRGAQFFGKEDLRSLFQEAAEPVPKNIPRDINTTIRLGWIAARPEDKNTYYITSKGMDAVKAKFQDKPTTPAYLRRSKKKKEPVKKEEGT